MGEPRARLDRALDLVERLGNRLPDPLTLFVILGGVVLVASHLAAGAGLAVTHPGTGARVAAVSLLGPDGLRRVLGDAVEVFAAFPPLATVLTVLIGVGVAERSGLVAAVLRQLVAVVPPRLLTATLVFAGVNASLAADAGLVVLVPLGAVLFAAAGRHPIAGLAAGFAGVSGGFSANLFLTSLDPLLAGITQAGARLVDPAYVVLPTANWWFMIASVLLLTAVGTFVGERIVEPRLGAWVPPAGVERPSAAPPGPRERKALVAALVTLLLVLGFAAALVVPEGSLLRGPDGGVGPLYDALVLLLTFAFFAPGLAYGVVAGTIGSDRDVARMASESMATMGGYIVLAFAAAQFVAWFGWSNLGLIVADRGADALKEAGLVGAPLLLAFMAIAIVLDLLVASASAKWAVLAPVFVPMLMLLGISPEATQAVYRVGDSVANVITPLMPYFPLILAFARRWDERAGVGTIVSAMLPFSAAFALAWGVVILVWIGLGLPLGPGAPLGYPP